tara:strand:+ start:250 stop:801 length:552 start_codon:yes stop_codon:yes gene_type:complete
MTTKKLIRKKYFKIRKDKYFEISKDFFLPLKKIIDKRKNKTINLLSYYPSSYEVNTLKLFETKFKKKIKIYLPVLTGKNTMSFSEWKENDILQINRFGMLEPAILPKKIIPEIILVPMLAFDKKNNRLGYGGGFYDRYLNRYLSKDNEILTIGVAFSFQKYNRIPVNRDDKKMNFILTEKGIV